MQLILDSENTTDINSKMVSLDGESLDDKLSVAIQDLKSEITNGNKENIKDKSNIIADSEEVTNIEDDKEDKSQTLTLEPVKEVETLLLDDQPEENDVKIIEDSDSEETSNNIDNNKENKTETLISESGNNIEILQNETLEETKTTENNTSDISNKIDENGTANGEVVSKENNIDENDIQDDDCIVTDYKERETNVIKTVEGIENDSDTCKNTDAKSSDETEQKSCVVEDKTSKEEECTQETIDIIDDDKPPEVNNSVDNQVVANEEEKDKKIEDTCTIEDDIVCVNLDTDSTNNIVVEKKAEENAMDCDEVTEVNGRDDQNVTKSTQAVQCEANIDEDLKVVEESIDETNQNEDSKSMENVPETVNTEKKVASSICKLSNTLDILSDDEEEAELPKTDSSSDNLSKPEKQCVEVEDDDDIMLIDEVEDNKGVQTQESKVETENTTSDIKPEQNEQESKVDVDDKKSFEVTSTIEQEPISKDNVDGSRSPKICEKTIEMPKEKLVDEKPLLSENFLKTCKKNFTDMTRNDLEEFCVLKIVESIVDRSNLNEIKTKLKNLTQNLEDFKKKTMMLTKQNRDLQVVLKSIQEEQKKMTDVPITPLKITRSVGMQVLITEKALRRKGIGGSNFNSNNASQSRPRIPTNPSPKPQKSNNNPQQIPVPRLVPASNNSTSKSPVTPANSNPGKTISPLPNGVKNSPPQKLAEKRPLNRMQSVTVDLTDDEPPTKIAAKSPQTNAPVRLVPPQNLLAPQRPQFNQTVNSPRKVYIPISGPQGQVRPGQTIMVKTAPPPGPRQRCPTPQMARMQQNPVRITRVQNARHPAPLPDAMKQYQPPNWKALPPAPDLKLSKVENGIVISWKIDGYQEDSYEEIASYQLYAYQETSSPPSTALWKKIGDVKALPLPMACTLTQFMAGFKYYFAVRAVDVRSRLGPFSLPGSILLLNKM